MHIFLTGEIQVGKSTLIDKVLRQMPDVRLAGFRTVTVADLPGALGSVYIVDAADAAPECTYVIDPEVCIACGACAGVCPVGAPQEQ